MSNICSLRRWNFFFGLFYVVQSIIQQYHESMSQLVYLLWTACRSFFFVLQIWIRWFMRECHVYWLNVVFGHGKQPPHYTNYFYNLPKYKTVSYVLNHFFLLSNHWCTLYNVHTTASFITDSFYQKIYIKW